MARSLLSTKIQVPPLPPRIVQRKRLLEVLDQGLQPNIRLTLVSAPAGYGKTTLLSAWVQDRKLPTAWLSLDEGDNDPMRFMSYLLAALKKGYPNLDLPALPEGQLSQADIQEALLIPMINQMGRTPEPKLLVLDDLHWIQNQTVHDGLGYFIENLPPQALINIATRSDPPLPMTRLRGRGQVNELRMESLRFMQGEAESFLRSFTDLELTSKDVATLTRRTEGWVSGLQMAAVSLRGHEDKKTFIKDFSGSHHYIMDYLLDEVLNRQSLQVQRFLLNTSILDRMCGALCDALNETFGNGATSSANILHDLENANLFIVPLDDTRNWYRYHRLFGDLLQERLQRESPERVPGLHLSASKWLEDHGYVDGAVQHALQSKDYAFAADLIERTSQEIMMRSETLTFLRWLWRLPESEIQKRPKLGIYRAWSLLFHGAPLSTVEAHLQKGKGESGPPGSSQSLQAFIALCQGQLESGLELANQALDELPAEEVYLHDFATLCAASARISLGEEEDSIQLLEQTYQASQQSGNRTGAVIMLSEIAELRQRQLQLGQSQQLYQRALALATDEGGNLLPIAGRALMGLGDLELERCEFEEAERLIQKGIKHAEGWNLINTLYGHISLAQIHQAKGDTDATQESLRTLRDIAQRFDASELDDIIVELLEIGLKLQQGDLESARKWAVDRGLDQAPSRKPPSYSDDLLRSKLYRYELPTLARLRIAENRYEEALEILYELTSLAEQPKRPYLQIDADILRAKVFQAMGDMRSSLPALRRALEMAAPENVMRPFVVEGDNVIQLLKAGRSVWDSSELIRFVDQILQKVEPQVPSQHAPIPDTPEPLTRRELEVLRLLPTGLTAEELADKLSISVNTLRTHLKNIYAKLGVHSRHEAVVKATKLNLL